MTKRRPNTSELSAAASLEKYYGPTDDCAERREAEDIVRKVSDVEITIMLRKAGRDSGLVQQLRNVLLDFGIGTLTRLASEHVLFDRLRQWRIKLPPPPESYPSDVRQIIFVAVYTAAPKFIDEAIFQGRWHPSGGASLATYFVGKCFYSFAAEYRQYCREERDVNVELTGASSPDVDDPSRIYLGGSVLSRDPETTAILRDDVERLFPKGAPSNVRLIFLLAANGFTQREIAEELEISEAAVSSATRRFRGRIRRTFGQD